MRKLEDLFSTIVMAGTSVLLLIVVASLGYSVLYNIMKNPVW